MPCGQNDRLSTVGGAMHSDRGSFFTGFSAAFLVNELATAHTRLCDCPRTMAFSLQSAFIWGPWGLRIAEASKQGSQTPGRDESSGPRSPNGNFKT